MEAGRRATLWWGTVLPLHCLVKLHMEMATSPSHATNTPKPYSVQEEIIFFETSITCSVGNYTERPSSYPEGTTIHTPLGHHAWHRSGGAAQDLPKLGTSLGTFTISSIHRHLLLPAVHSHHNGAVSVFSSQTN